MTAAKKANGKKEAAKLGAPPTSERKRTDTNKKKEDKAPPEPLEGGDAKAPVYKSIPWSAIRIVKGLNPRTRPRDDLDELVMSIKKHGVLQNPVVRPVGGKPGVYELIVGERRYHACKQLKIAQVVCQLRKDFVGDDVLALLAMGAENSGDARKNLNPIEIGQWAERIREESKGEKSVEQIAKQAGLHQRKIRRCMELLSADKVLQQRVEEGVMSVNTALEAVKYTDPQSKRRIRAALKSDPGMSRDAVRKLGRQVARESGVMPPASKGGGRAPSLVVYRSATEKAGTLAEVCHLFQSLPEEALPTEEEEGSVDFHMLRGIAVALLWERGDLTGVIPPRYDPDSEDEKYEEQVKALDEFNAMIGVRAESYTPPPESAEGE